jgi:M6 family metalloprotease-like protein
VNKYFNLFRKAGRLSLFVLFTAVLFIVTLKPKNCYAVQSINGRPGPVEFVNRPEGITVQQFKDAHAGTETVAVILVDFSSSGSGTSGEITMTEEDIDNIESYFNTGPKNFEDYYEKVSYGDFIPKVTFSVKGGTRSTLDGIKSTHPFTMPFSMAFYGQDSQNSLETLIKDALNVSSINNNDYDYVVVAHAGYGNESTDPEDPGNIWSVSVGFASGPENGFTTGAVIPAREAGELSPFGVICHEFGHQLGLPDLYDTYTGVSVFGPLALMDSGVWNDDGKTPPHLCAWSKIAEGWLTPAVLGEEKSGVVTYSYFDISADVSAEFSGASTVKKIYVPGKTTEYFLLSYRKEGGTYDNADYNSGRTINWGPLIEHVDETVGSVAENTINSSFYSHPRVYAVTGGGWDITETFTAPYSNAHDGTITGINIYDFNEFPDHLTYSFTIAEFTAGKGFIEKPLNFPNPVRGSDLKTTISFKVKKPDNDRSVRIYTPAGSLVKSIDKELIISRYVQDNEVVYQADWNLNNESGRQVSSGIYFYHVEAGSKSDFGTAVLIR